MQVKESRLPEVLTIEPKIFTDERGMFMETWNQSRYAEFGIPSGFVQDNISVSKKGVIRGLHFQNPIQQGKLIQVLQGEIFDVAVDIRTDSEYFGQWVGIRLSEQNKRQLYIPEGYAHGFCVVSDSAVVAYKCTDYYSYQSEKCLRWDDPQLDIEWPAMNPILSDKDQQGVLLQDFPVQFLPTMRNE